METDIVEKKSEHVPLADYENLVKKYEKLPQEHESLTKTVELLKSTFGFTLALVNNQEQKLVPKELIKEWESNISEMQKRIWRNQGNESCHPISLEEPGATNPSLSAREDSLPEVHRKGSKKKREKKREKKKKEDSFCDEKMVDDAEKITPQDHADTTCSQEEKINRKRDRNTLKESNIADVTLEQGMSTDVNAKTQCPKSKRRKKRKTKTMDVDKSLHVNDAENGGGEEETFVASFMVNLKSKEDKEELRENTDVKLSEDVVQTQIPKAKRRKKKKAKAMEVCDPLGSVQVVETTEKKKEDPLGTVQVVECTEKEKEDKTGELVHGGFEGEDDKTKESEMKEIALDHVLQGVSPAETGDVPKCPWNSWRCCSRIYWTICSR